MKQQWYAIRVDGVVVAHATRHEDGTEEVRFTEDCPDIIMERMLKAADEAGLKPVQDA